MEVTLFVENLCYSLRIGQKPMASLEKKRFHLELGTSEFKRMKGNYQKKKEFTVSLEFSFDSRIMHSVMIT